MFSTGRDRKSRKTYAAERFEKLRPSSSFVRRKAIVFDDGLQVFRGGVFNHRRSVFLHRKVPSPHAEPGCGDVGVEIGDTS